MKIKIPIDPIHAVVFLNDKDSSAEIIENSLTPDW